MTGPSGPSERELGGTRLMLEAAAISSIAMACAESDDGPSSCRKSRYVDDEYATLERRLLWPTVWQMACLTTDVAAPATGSNTAWPMYRSSCCRPRRRTARISQVCSHRVKLCEGSVEQPTQSALRLSRMALRLDGCGPGDHVPTRFGHIERDRYGLRPVRIAAWEQMVFVTPPPTVSRSTSSSIRYHVLAPFAWENECAHSLHSRDAGQLKVTVDALTRCTTALSAPAAVGDDG